MTKEVERVLLDRDETRKMSVPTICKDEDDEEVEDVEEGMPISTNKLLQRRRLHPDTCQQTGLTQLRSCSFKNRPRPKFLDVDTERPRRCSLPSPSANLLSVSYDDGYRHRANSSEPLKRVRSFKTTSKGGIVNRGDSFKKSCTSISSTGSAMTNDNLARKGSINRTRPRVNSVHSKDSGTAESTSSSSSTHSFYRVGVLGEKGVGKTALTNQFMTSEYVAFEAENDDTVEDRPVTVLLDSQESTLEFIDRPIEKTEFREKTMDAYIAVYSITDRASFQVAIDTLYCLRHETGTDRPIILIANKIDLVRKRKVSKEEGRSIATQYESKYAETSAALNHHVDELLVGILSQIRIKLAPNVPVSTPNIEAAPPQRGGKSKLTGTRKLLNKIFKRNTCKSSQHACENLYAP